VSFVSGFRDFTTSYHELESREGNIKRKSVHKHVNWVMEVGMSAFQNNGP